MGIYAAFSKHRLIWVVFFLSNGMLPLVNTIEGSFARTLIHCETPAPADAGALFSGSALCGDRLRVINEGQVLSSAAASQEGVAKIAMMLAAAVLTDTYGRKPVLLAGLASTAMSVALFAIACTTGRHAKTLFILGQALQGAYPVDLLFQQVTADLAQRMPEERMAIFELQGVVKFLPVVLFGFVAFAVQVLELRSYFWLWCCVLLVNIGLAAFAALSLPETRPLSMKPAAGQGLLEGMRRELAEYYGLFVETRSYGSLEMVLAYILVDAMSRAKFTNLIFSYSMSYYDLSTAEVILQAAPVVLIHTLSTPLVGKVCQWAGMRRGFVLVCAYKAAACGLFVLQPFQQWAWFAQYYLSSTASGWDALMSSVSQAVFQEKTSKYVALTTLCSYGSSVAAAPLYAAAFDAKATSYRERVLPGLISFSLYLAAMCLLFLPRTRVWSLFCRGLDEMQGDYDKRQSGENVDATTLPKGAAGKKVD